MKRAEICAKIGAIEQLAGIREVREAATGMRLIEIDNGLMQLTILADRGFDVGGVRCYGQNYAFLAKGGLGYVPERDILGGLFFTCGPDNVGPAENGMPMHGSFRMTGADQISQETWWDGDRYRLRVSGRLVCGKLFGGRIVMRRTIETEYGSASFRVKDEIENEGAFVWPLMLLYHINSGYPLLDTGSRVEIPPCRTYLRGGTEEVSPEVWQTMPAPAPQVPERVYYHEGIAGDVTLRLFHPENNHALSISYDAAVLPVLTQWISVASGDYVMGLEPGNCHVEGLSGEEARGSTERLMPGEKKTIHLTFAFS